MATVQWVREAGGASDPDAMSRAVHRGSVGYPVVSCACRVTPGCPCVMVHDCISSMRASAAKYTGVGSGREARAGMVGRRLHATTDNYRRGPSMAGRCLRCMHIRVVTRVCVLACVRALEIAFVSIACTHVDEAKRKRRRFLECRNLHAMYRYHE